MKKKGKKKNSDESLNGRAQLGQTVVDDRIIVKWTLRESDLRQGSLVDRYEQSNEA
jgi:hypothetical protein